MSNNGQISINLRQPVGLFLKCLMVLLSAFLLAFLVGALLGECEEPVWKWLIVAMAVVPAIGCAVSTLFVLWGQKYLLLKDDAARAKEIIAGFEPQFASKEAYFEYVDALAGEGDRITYREGGADVRL